MEQRLAVARALLAIASLVCVYAGFAPQLRESATGTVLLVAYGAFSVGLLVFSQRSSTHARSFPLIVHSIDVTSAAALASIAGDLLAPPFLLLLFTIVAFAYRWGLRAAMMLAVGLVVVLLAATTALAKAGLAGLSAAPLERNVLGVAYLLLLGYLVGDLAAGETATRAEAASIAALNSMIRLEDGVSGSLQAVFTHLSALAGMRAWRVGFHDAPSGRSYLWASGFAGSSTSPHRWRELSAAEAAAYFFDIPAGAGAFHATRRDGETSVQWLDEQGRRIGSADDRAVRALVSGESWRSALGIIVKAGDESAARIVFLDEEVRGGPGPRLARVQRVVRQVFPALYNLYLLRRLRTRAGEIERARVARELHDGVIQSLIGLEMQVAVLRRETSSATVGPELQKIESLLHQEILNLRDLMQQMRPIHADARNLLQILSDLVERFRRETGIETEFVSAVDEVDLPPRMCSEVARILQEALVNVRKHSGAAHVVVRFGTREGAWTLSIDDDGCGFDFAGRMTQDALDAARKGPIVIKERVRAIRGVLTIESSPGHGARLEIALPGRQ